MKGLEVAIHVASGDSVVEGGNGEYLQWHEEGELNSVWWTSERASLTKTVNAVRGISARFDINSIEAAIGRLGDRGVQLLPLNSVLEMAVKDATVLDYFAVDFPGFSFCWMSPESPGRERYDSSYGEVSIVFSSNDQKDLITKFVGLSATRSIGGHAVGLVDLFLPKDT